MSARLVRDEDTTPPVLDAISEVPAWESTLEDLERAVVRVETGLSMQQREEDFLGLLTFDGPWVPPGGLGPVPDHLRARAAVLLQRQLGAAQDLVGQITMSKKQREIAARMSYSEARPAAAFFDQTL